MYPSFQNLIVKTAWNPLISDEVTHKNKLAPFLWPTVYIFGGSYPHMEFCQVQNSLCVQVLRCPILAALLHGTTAASVSQTLRRGTRNGIMKLLQTASPRFRWAAITLGIGPHSCFRMYPATQVDSAFWTNWDAVCVIDSDLPTESYVRWGSSGATATKFGMQFAIACFAGYNFVSMTASNTLLDSWGKFLGSSYPMKT